MLVKLSLGCLLLPFDVPVTVFDVTGFSQNNYLLTFTKVKPKIPNHYRPRYFLNAFSTFWNSGSQPGCQEIVAVVPPIINFY